jgi:hypothetical protein
MATLSVLTALLAVTYVHKNTEGARVSMATMVIQTCHDVIAYLVNINNNPITSSQDSAVA